MIRVYLDNCCYNRPFDNKGNLLVRLEAEAKLHIQQMIKDGELELVWSYLMDFENDANPYTERRDRIALWQGIAKFDIEENENILETAHKLEKIGLREKDSLHIACAVFSKAEYFITTDKKILNKTIDSITVINPIDFLRRYYNG
jgi:predicted nucleic acid-binding protein